MEGGVNLVTTAMQNVSTVFTAATTMITGNAIAMVFIGFSLAGAGVGLFRKVIRRK